MEKVFQINLAGMLFTIEEQAYHQLKQYLDKLHVHFAGDSEIVQDIESRMAELFSKRLVGGRSTLFAKDVDEVISVLGHINQMDEQAHAQPKTAYELPKNRKLRRNPNDQSLGGVCSGLASFFDVDPVLIRVLFVLGVIAYGGGIMLYLILWIVVPEAKGDEVFQMIKQKENKTKRLFRDADNRMVGGVSAGLSSYFGIDRTWIRLGFLAAIFLFGTGFWLYIILWIIVPKAVSATDKLLMRGEPVDIHSIEREIRQSQGSNKMNSFAQHGSHVIGIIVKGFFKFLAGIFALILFVTIVGSSIGMVALFFNLGNTHFLNQLINFTVKDASILYAAKIGVLLTILIPLIGLLMVVIKLLFKVKFLNRNWAMAFVAFFLVGVLALAYAGVKMAGNVSQTESSISVNKIPKTDTLYLEGVEMPFTDDESMQSEDESELAFNDKGVMMGKDGYYFEIDDVKIKRGKSDSIVFKIARRANGRDGEDANAKLEMIEFTPQIIGNKIIIPSYFKLSKEKQFSWQEVDVTLWIPEGTVIAPDMIVKEILDDANLDEADGEYYKFVNGELTCLDCKPESDEAYQEDEDESSDINFEINDKGEKVNMQIKISDENGDTENTKTEKIITKDGKEVIVKEAKAGPITIKTTKEVKKKNTHLEHH